MTAAQHRALVARACNDLNAELTVALSALSPYDDADSTAATDAMVRAAGLVEGLARYAASPVDGGVA